MGRNSACFWSLFGVSVLKNTFIACNHGDYHYYLAQPRISFIRPHTSGPIVLLSRFEQIHNSLSDLYLTSSQIEAISYTSEMRPIIGREPGGEDEFFKAATAVLTLATKQIGLYNIFKTAQVRATRTISFTLLFNRLLASLLFFSLRRRRQPLPISERLNPQIPDRARYNI